MQSRARQILSVAVLVSVLACALAAVGLIQRDAGASVIIEHAVPAPALVSAILPLPANAGASTFQPAPSTSDDEQPRFEAPVPLTAPVAPQEDGGLLAAIRAALGGDAADASVVVRRLSDGVTAVWNPDRVYYAASTYKLEVLYEAYRRRLAGDLNFDREQPLEERFIDEDLGTLDLVPRGPHGGLVIDDAVRAMVTLSDNTSATLLLDLLGGRAIDTTMRRLGLTDSSVNTEALPTTAADMARLMEAIVRGDGLDRAATGEMTALLLAQETRAGIPRAVPSGVPVGNKTGTWEGATHDVAVVFAPSGTYVIAVLTDNAWDWDPIVRVSRAVYAYLER